MSKAIELLKEYKELVLKLWEIKCAECHPENAQEQELKLKEIDQALVLLKKESQYEQRS